MTPSHKPFSQHQRRPNQTGHRNSMNSDRFGPPLPPSGIPNTQAGIDHILLACETQAIPATTIHDSRWPPRRGTRLHGSLEFYALCGWDGQRHRHRQRQKAPVLKKTGEFSRLHDAKGCGLGRCVGGYGMGSETRIGGRERPDVWNGGRRVVKGSGHLVAWIVEDGGGRGWFGV